MSKKVTRCQRDKLGMSIVLINIDSFNDIKDKINQEIVP